MCTYLSYDRVREVGASKHLAHLSHHVLEDFEEAAIEHLNGCYERIHQHANELQQVAKVIADAAAQQAAFAKNGGFEDAIINGIAPDGSFEWPNTGIVRVLRAALDVHAVDAWVRLDDAKAWITEHHPEQTPEKYGCRSWPHVLSDSRLFQLQHRTDEDGIKVAWYRAR